MPQRFSQQRERIYQTVLESRAHPTAEMVYQQPAGLCWIWRLCPMTRGWTVWLRPRAAWSRATP